MDIIEILEDAIKAEYEGQEKYLKLSKEATDPETRAVLEQLASEEKNHAALLKERLTALKLMRGI